MEAQRRNTLIFLAVIAVVLIVALFLFFGGGSGEQKGDYNQTQQYQSASPEDPSPSDGESESYPSLDSGSSGAAWDTGDVQPPDAQSVERLSLDDLEEFEQTTPEGMEPDELVETAASIMLSWDAHEDTSKTDGYRRALNLFTDDFDEVFTAPENPTFSEEWWDAMDHNGRSTGWAAITDEYDDGDTIEYRVVALPTWVGDDKWAVQEESRNWTFTVQRDGDDWIISNFTEGAPQ